ncbi:MAG: hypothetical protein R3B81_14800 [bacterium]
MFRWTCSAIAVACLVFSVSGLPAFGLERTRELALDSPSESPWTEAVTCALQYYNYCTGWSWFWAAEDGDRTGTVFEACHSDCEVLSASALFVNSSQYGRGFMSLLGLYAVDENDCPQEPPLASMYYVQSGGWHTFDFGGVAVPPRFAIMTTHTNYHYPGIDVGFVSDHPAAGPTGPPACGTCFPSDRVGHSYFWGNVDSPGCPGTLIEDTACPAEFLVNVQLSCASAVPQSSWSRLRSMFR